MISGNSTFIHVGQAYVDYAPHAISTVLGSCVAVCLYDPIAGVGGMNHYLLPFWNGNGLQSLKYGNIAIPKLIEMMEKKGSRVASMKAKVFGGASMNSNRVNNMMIGEKNIMVAKDILSSYNIEILAHDLGGYSGRKVQFNIETGKVLMKYTEKCQ
jgi:chemotaxis protein CheD